MTDGIDTTDHLARIFREAEAMSKTDARQEAIERLDDVIKGEMHAGCGSECKAVRKAVDDVRVAELVHEHADGCVAPRPDDHPRCKRCARIAAIKEGRT